MTLRIGLFWSCVNPQRISHLTSEAVRASGEGMDSSLLPIENRIYRIRGQSVMLDRDLAALYGVSTKALKQAVKRNIERFPVDFMFELGLDELKYLRSQIVTSSLRYESIKRCLRSQFVTLNDENASIQPNTRSQFVTLNPNGRNIDQLPKK